jgi:SAM-dependent methyltransferase
VSPRQPAAPEAHLDPREAAALWEANAETWTRHSRAGFDLYRDLVNTPAFLAMLPEIAGLTGLDIGCGEASNTGKLAQRGASMVAIDHSATFLRHALAAERVSRRGIAFARADAGTLPFGDSSFDFATAFMSLMDMPHHDRALAEAFRVLRPGGFLQLSILHPCFAPPHRRVVREADGRVVALEIAGYFDRIDGRVDRWWFGAAPPEERASTEPFSEPRFHRTLSEWINLMVSIGFVVEQLGEPKADEATARAEPYVADTLVAPLFLHVRARKPR